MGEPLFRGQLHSMRRGFTIIELTVALLLLAIALSALLPAARRQRDRMAVLAAREAAVSLVVRTRREARLSGGATLRMLRDAGLAWIETGQPSPDTLDFQRRFGVQVELSSSRAAVAFDALGIGRLASRSLGFQRGGEEAGLTISAYGRVRRW